MSRIGRTPVTIPPGVEIKVSEENIVTVKGPKGKLETVIPPEIKVDVGGAEVIVTRPSDAPGHRSMHGLSRSLINNMVIGVTEGYKKELEISGVGFRAVKEGKKLVMNLGFSHQIIIEEADGITIDVPSPTRVIINGIDKQKVGQFATDIRKKRPPSPYVYKGKEWKGVKYSDEVLRFKEGKTGAK